MRDGTRPRACFCRTPPRPERVERYLSHTVSPQLGRVVTSRDEDVTLTRHVSPRHVGSSASGRVTGLAQERIPGYLLLSAGVESRSLVWADIQ